MKRRSLLAGVALGLSSLAGCAHEADTGETQQMHDECDDFDTVEFYAYVVVEPPAGATPVRSTDDRFEASPTFEQLFEELDEWADETDEREPKSTSTYGDVFGEVVVTRDACDEDAKRASETYDDLPHSETEAGAPGVYVEHGNVTAFVERSTVSYDE